MALWIRPENSPIKLPLVFASSREEDTFALGGRLASLLDKGSIVALKGGLGAGKTCLVKGITRGLGVEEEVTSPAYTIISEYDGTDTRVYHIDAYRLKGNDDFSAIGGEEIIFSDGISLIEWSCRIDSMLPAEAFRVDIEIKEGSHRLIRIFQDTSPLPAAIE